MPHPTRPASVRMVQYCPLCQRLLSPMAQPFLNWIGRVIVRGRGSLMARSSVWEGILPRPRCRDQDAVLDRGGGHLRRLIGRGQGEPKARGKQAPWSAAIHRRSFSVFLLFIPSFVRPVRGGPKEEETKSGDESPHSRGSMRAKKRCQVGE